MVWRRRLDSHYSPTWFGVALLIAPYPLIHPQPHSTHSSTPYQAAWFLFPAVKTFPVVLPLPSYGFTRRRTLIPNLPTTPTTFPLPFTVPVQLRFLFPPRCCARHHLPASLFVLVCGGVNEQRRRSLPCGFVLLLIRYARANCCCGSLHYHRFGLLPSLHYAGKL